VEHKNLIGFYHENEEYGCFSNWFHCDFEYVGNHFVSTEQFMMYYKVLIFRQYDLAQKIMNETDPSIIKKLGRTRFPAFDKYIWDSISPTIVKRGVRAKFLQNPEISKILLDTGDTLLAECSQRDERWGVGVDINDPDHTNVEKWTGMNLLGRILMDVRDELRVLEQKGDLLHIEAYDEDFGAWHMRAGELLRIPKYHATIKAYADTLNGKYERECFYYQCPIEQWEYAMRTNMGGGLPAIGFYEMKQDVCDISRITA